MKKRGVGVACMYYGIGKTGVPGPAGAVAEILENGSVIVLTGLADMGQGANTGIAQIAAQAAGVPLEMVTVITGDTAITPDAGVTSASRSTYVVGNAVLQAVRQAMEPMLQEAAKALQVSTSDLVVAAGKIFASQGSKEFVQIKEMISACKAKGVQLFAAVSYVPQFERLDPNTGLGSPYPTYAFATQVAEVEVDTETGQVEVLRVTAAHDVGKAINPSLIEGQVEGGISQGLGQALMEEVKFSNGKIVSGNLSTYLLPTSLDMCEVETILVEAHEPRGPFGAKGVGEPASIPTMSAIAGAIYDAVGVLITELPATPEKILAGLQALKDGTENHAE